MRTNIFSKAGMMLLALFLVLSILATPVLALDENSADTNTGSGSGGRLTIAVETKQKAELFVIDKTITLLNISTASAASLASVSPESAQQTIDFLNEMIATLEDFRTQVTEATTTEELTSINTEMKAYLVASKSEYRAQVHSIVASFANDALVKANQYITIANSTLEVYQVKCPGQSASIDNVQKQLTELSAAATSLNDAIQVSDAAGMKAGVKEVSSLMVSITAQLTALDNAVYNGLDTTCNIY